MNPMTPKLTLTEMYDAEKIKVLGQKLMDFNRNNSGVPLNHRALTIYVNDPETDELIGGLWGARPIPLFTLNWFIFPKLCEAQGWVAN